MSQTIATTVTTNDLIFTARRYAVTVCQSFRQKPALYKNG